MKSGLVATIDYFPPTYSIYSKVEILLEVIQKNVLLTWNLVSFNVM